METRPPKKSFWMVPFTVQVTRGLLRDERSRRKTMVISLLVAVLMLVSFIEAEAGLVTVQ